MKIRKNLDVEPLKDTIETYSSDYSCHEKCSEEV
jgi:hypothetical protein